MKKGSAIFVFTAILVLASNGCGANQTSGVAPAEPTGTSAAPPITPLPKGKTIIVTSAENSGPGTLRQALLDAQAGDAITFDPQVFPPDNPTTIFLDNESQDKALPEITQGDLTIDASDAGVILDGSQTKGEWVNCLSIRSDGNVIRGLQMVNFPGSAVHLWDGAQDNTIGGDRSIGLGPVGQGNLSSNNWVGMDIQGDGTSFNTIIGNVIGTDVDGLSDQGNRETGIYISDGASHNMIGPGNIIAYNGEGIQVYRPTSVSNTITQNNIHDSDTKGISLNGEGNAYLDPPSIVGFNLSSGSITAFTCANCTVEIFSDDGTEGEIFEGQGKADNAGIFNFERGTSFGGPSLTATTTDLDGNTSGFSLPTTNTQKSASDALESKLIQIGNDYPLIALESRQSRELEDNRMGTFTGSSLWHPVREPEIFPEGVLDTRYVLEMGFKRFRLGINCLDSVRVDWEKPEFSIDPSHDAFISELADNGITLTYVLSFWDIAYKSEGGEIRIPRFKTEEEIQRYLDYVRFIVDHFKDRIEYYEIWNEPNMRDTIQWIEAEDYINLVRRAVPVIRQEYPQAKIQVGGTTSLIDPDSQAYLFEILNSDIMPLVDVVSWHPMYGQSPEYDGHRQYYYAYPALVQEIKDVASARGFEGEYEADEIHWPTPAQPEEGWPTYSNIQSIKYLTRSIMMHRGMDLTVTQLLQVGSMQLHRTNGYLNTVMSGVELTELPMEIQSEATNITSYSFSLPNGDQLLAVWNDNIAVDYDPGTSSMLVIPGFTGWKATGIDVLNGFEQELVSTDEADNLVIRDFLLKDYPIIIHLSQ